MNKTKAKVKIKNKLGDAFTFDTGVRQGNGLSAVLFNLALHYVIQKAGRGLYSTSRVKYVPMQIT